MHTTNHGPNSTEAATVVAFPGSWEGELRAMRRRLNAGDAGAVADAMRLAAELEEHPKREGLTSQLCRRAEAEAARYYAMADELHEAVARIGGRAPSVLAAKAELVERWLRDGEPRYAAELVRTLRDGLDALATMEAQRHG